MQIKDSVAMVTGGAGGLGSATAERLVKSGAQVVLCDRNERRGTEFAARFGDSCWFVPTDVGDEASVQAAIDVAIGLGPLRILVNAHGGAGDPGRIVDRKGAPMPLETFTLTVATYLTATFNVMRLTAAAMTRNPPDEIGGRGVIVNTASIAGYEGQVGQAAYAAAKGGVIALTLTSARDLSNSGIRVVAIAPGTMFTPAYRMDEAAAQDAFGNSVPFPKRMGRAVEYAALAESIITNDYLNGEVIRLDGALRFAAK